MRTELIYLWINKDKNGCFQQEGFNFSPEYSVSYSPETKELKIGKCDTINVFRNDNIANVTAIIGENGTGKTTFLEFITGLSCLPLTEENRKEYQHFNDKQNELRTFIAVYMEPDNAEFRVINITPDKIHLHDLITPHSKVIEPYSAENFRQENYIGHISHIYLSNSAYNGQNQNLRNGGTVSYIMLTDATLSTFSYDFYREKYGFPAIGSIPDTPFSALEDLLASQENSQSMQMFFDLLFYIYLGNSGRKFQGKRLDSISFTIKNLLSKLPAPETISPSNYKAKYFAKERLTKVYNKYQTVATQIGRDTIWSSIICNLIFELLFVFEGFSLEVMSEDCLTADAIFAQCKKFIGKLHEGDEKTYYKDVIKEIAIFKKALAHAKYTDNTLHQDNVAKEVLAQVYVSKFEPLIDHIKNGHSFLLKYLDIRNVGMSSGERAELNFMSRMYLAPKLHEFFSKPQFLLQENILLLIDEIDLYLHPEWQRQILNDLLNAIKEAFPKNYVQVIITSHSPIILSDIPRGNSIFLQCQDGKIVQAKREIQTFGANIYSLYKDAFFIKDGLAMGSFARKTINSWIEEIKTGKKDEDDIRKIIELIGEPVIRKRLERMAQMDRPGLVEKTMEPDERQRILEFLRMQKAAIQQQIDTLEAQRND